MHAVADILFWTYCVVGAGLTVLGLYRAVLLLAWMRTRRRAAGVPPAGGRAAAGQAAGGQPAGGYPDGGHPAAPREWPVVTVQLPLYNERFVARRLLQAVARLDYPLDRLQVQILDDSTDRTSVLVARITRLLRGRGLDAVHVRRRGRDGYKAGALAHGLPTARGEVLAIFDADFVPPADFLRRIVPSVLEPGVGAVQARWGHINREASWFTRLQSILLDGHFAIEQPARAGNRWLLTFNGTAGIWRRTAIEDAGGWTHDTLTEDLDLSMRAQLAGWRIVYRDDIVVPAELPADTNAFRTQQRRWTKGGVQVARKILPRLVQAPLPWHVRAEAVVHLVSYAAYPLLVALALLRTPVRLLCPSQVRLGFLPGEVPLLLLGTLPLAVFYTLAQRTAGVPGSMRRLLRDALPAMALGAGLALGNAIAVLDGLFGRSVVFDRTPKRGVHHPADPRAMRTVRAVYRSPGTRIAILELLLLAYLITGKIVAGRSRWGEFPFLAFFAYGLLAMALPSLRQGWQDTRRRAAGALP